MEKLNKNSGFTLVEIMIVVAIIALLSIMAIPHLVRSRVNANEATAQATLKVIATASESYLTGNPTYPTSWDNIVAAAPPYISENYELVSPRSGYNYNCTFAGAGGYSCTAIPVTCNQTGTKSYTITTGAVLTQAEC